MVGGPSLTTPGWPKTGSCRPTVTLTSHLDQSEKREDDSSGHRQLCNAGQPPAGIHGAAQERRSLVNVLPLSPDPQKRGITRGRALTSPSRVITASRVTPGEGRRTALWRDDAGPINA